jgi:hypothetical protein
MTWGYLSEFWNAITEVIDYPVEWFQSIGNAVAGAIGGLFEDLTHHFYDVFYFFNWLFDNLGSMIIVAFSPLNWVFNYIDGFLTSATSSLAELGIEVQEITVYSTNVHNFLDAIPYFNFIVNGVAGCLGIFFLIFIVKTIKDI